MPGLLFLPPSAPLRGWVRQHQFVRLHFGAGEVVPAKPYWPRPAACLAFYPRDAELVGSGLNRPDQRKPRAALIGQPTVLSMRQGGHNFAVYQIELQPGALRRWLGLRLDPLCDTWIDAEAVFPPDFGALVNRIEDLDEPLAQLAAAERYLLGLCAATRRPALAADAVARRVLAAPGHGIDALAREHGIGPRQLLRDMAASAGVGPKLLARIARFDAAVRLANRHPGLNWLELALEAGYHDHQHLARDFRQFTLSSPSAFLALERGAPERRFGLVE
jgi:AraC-like DNA-binding protein